MYRLFNFQVIVAVILLSGVTLSCAWPECGSPLPDVSAADSPANASYLIENDRVQLENGRAEWQSAPGSAAKIEIMLFGEAAHGDLNNDGVEDAVLFLTYQGGGSGTFFILQPHFKKTGNIEAQARFGSATASVHRL